MPDNDLVQAEVVKELITQACKLVAAKPDVPKGRGEFEVAVLESALYLRSLTAGSSMISRTLTATPIIGTIVSVDFEESSQRYVIRYKPDRPREGYDDTETIRSDRVDSFRGELVKKLWEDKAGKHVRLFKTLEKTNNPKRPTVRIAPYVQVLGTKEQ